MSPWEILGWLVVVIVFATVILFCIMLPIVWQARREFWQDFDKKRERIDRTRAEVDASVRDHYRGAGQWRRDSDKPGM